MQRSYLNILAMAMVALLLSQCNAFKNQDKKNNLESAEKLYEGALVLMKERAYRKAAEQFALVEQEYPYSKWAIEAQIMEAYNFYVDRQYDQAQSVIERFIRFHPGNDNIPYMYYLRALCSYEQIADITRDQQKTKQALEYLRDIVGRFPETEYARDATWKIDLAMDHLAGKELEVARFYIKQNQWIAAIGRLQSVITTYQRTSHVPEALYRLTATYYTLGIKTEAQRYAAILGHNYPDNQWYKASYSLLTGKKDILPPEQSWLERWKPQSLKRALPPSFIGTNTEEKKKK